MKTYIFTEKSRTISRTYGGSNYTLAVYQVKNANEIIHIGNCSACTRGHKGEISEAWTVVFNSLSKRKQNQIKKINSLPENKNLGMVNYYSWSYTPKLTGITLLQI
jgi:hypothetical protein